MKLRRFFILSLLWSSGLSTSAVDREAFTFTRYDLNVRVEPEQQRLAVRGKMWLRNDSTLPQKNIALQISSSLDWRAIRLAGKPVQFLTHAYTSDVDHTGALTEAIVTLPAETAPKSTVELEIAYEGVIPIDATRLTRIGVPEEKARHSDWDQISKSFSAVRGIGYVTWYPIATDAASLSEADSVEETVARWKARDNEAAMRVTLESTQNWPVLFSGAGANSQGAASFEVERTGISTPTFVIAPYQELAAGEGLSIQYLADEQQSAKDLAEAAKQIEAPLPAMDSSTRLRILGLPDAEALPFVTEGMLLRPLTGPLSNETVLSIVYARALSRVSSERAWIQEGLAHYAQAAYIETDQDRRVALEYLGAHKATLIEAEKHIAESEPAQRSLINAPDDLYLQTKSMYVWWMLRDMLGHFPNDALLAYKPAEDKDAAYLQRLIERTTHQDLQWFFDDWVYRDRGLPDFRIVSVYSRRIVEAGYMVTVTVENLGGAGAEVPVTVRCGADELTKRLVVQGKSQASIRIETASLPQEAVVNDGSVPESDVTNNSFKVETPTDSTAEAKTN